MPAADAAGLDVRALQLAWALLLLAAPLLCWRAASAAGIAGTAGLAAVGLAAALALGAVAARPDAPLHANGHAWRTAREVLIPIRGPAAGLAPFEHGRAAPALAWAVAAAERRWRGDANPFRISRLAAAAAAGATALLAMMLTGSAAAGLAAGAVLALTPVAQALAVSGSPLAVAGGLMPWSLALLLAAARRGDRLLLAGAALAAALGILTHTAVLGWPAALIGAWLLAAPRRLRAGDAALLALAGMVAAWTLQATDTFALLAGRSAGEGFAAHVWLGVRRFDLFVDPAWVSPVLLPLALLGAVAWWRGGGAPSAAAALGLLAGVLPFFAVTACSSDAVRYQGALLGLATGFAVAGLWRLAVSLGRRAAALLVAAALALLVLLPPGRLPADPTSIEHALVIAALARLPAGALIVVPSSRSADGVILPVLPDFLLPAGAIAVAPGDPRIAAHGGPRFAYLGLGCISWQRHGPAPGMRPECTALRAGATPWAVRALSASDLPRSRDGRPWTFHRLALDEPFGFFALEGPLPPRR